MILPVALAVVLAAEETFKLVLFGLIVLGWILKQLFGDKVAQRRPHKIPPAEEAPAPIPMPRHEAVREIERAAEARGDAAPEKAFGTEGLAGEADAGDLAAAEAAAARHGQRHVEYVLRRLGGAKGTNVHSMTRAGMLWSEVLGPPLSWTGPHRSPVVRRNAARRR